MSIMVVCYDQLPTKGKTLVDLNNFWWDVMSAKFALKVIIEESFNRHPSIVVWPLRVVILAPMLMMVVCYDQFYLPTTWYEEEETNW